MRNALRLFVALGIVGAWLPAVTAGGADAGLPRARLDRSYDGSASQRVCLADARAQSAPRGLRGAATRVRVHYTLSPANAQALPRRARVDTDRNGVPDYVECIEAAGSFALEAYQRQGFRVPPRREIAGGTQIDIYVVKEIEQGAIGKAKYDRRGAYVEIRSDRDPAFPPSTRARYVSQGVWVTLAHELFHVVQSRYITTAKLPVWIREGTANAWASMLTGVSGDFHSDITKWLADSAVGPIYGNPKYDCVSCYGSAFFWTLFEFPEGAAITALPANPATIRLLELFAANPMRAHRVDGGWALVERAYTAAHPSRRTNLFSSFVDLAYAVTGPHPTAPTEWPAYRDTLPTASGSPAERRVALPPLATARLPIPVSPSAVGRVLEITVAASASTTSSFVALGGKLGVRLDSDTRQTRQRWRVDASGVGHACRLQGTPINLDAMPWHGVVSQVGLVAAPDAPTVNCMRGVVDLVVVNNSGSRKGTLQISYRLLPNAIEVPGLDVRGDAGDGDPDIGRVTVVPTRDAVAWGVAVAGWRPSSRAAIWIDADKNASTGIPGPDATGSDYLVIFDGATERTILFRWTGEWTVQAGASVRGAFTEGEAFPLVVEVDPRAIGDPLELRFLVLAGNADSTSGDVAPSAGWWEGVTWRGLWTR